MVARTLSRIFCALCCGALSACAVDHPAENPSPPASAATASQAAPSVFSSPLEEAFYRALIGEMAGFSGDYTLSASSFYQAAQQTRNPELAQRATEVALMNRDNALALEAARLWRTLDPDSMDGRQVLAAVLLRSGQTEAALQELDALLDRLPELSDQRLGMLLKLLRPGEDKDAALKLMARIADKRRNDPGVLEMYARLLEEVGQHERAQAVLEQVLALTPDNTDAMMMYVDILNQQDKRAQALDWLGRQVARRPNLDAWREIYARQLISADRHDEAIREFRLLLKKSPRDPDVLYALGLLSLQAKRLAEARGYFQRLLDTDSSERNTARYFLGQIAEEQRDFKQAVEWYGKVGKGPHYLNAQARVAMLLVEQGKVDQGLSHLQAIQTNNPRDELNLLLFEGEVLTKQKRYEDAMSLYDRALQNDPDNTDLLYSRGMVGERMGRLDILERDLRRVLELEPDNVDTLNALGYTLADLTDRYDEARALIEKALAAKPDAFHILDSMGWVLYRQGKYQEALEYLRKAYAAKQDPEVAAHLGEVLWASGDQAGARQIWREAEKLFPGHEKLQATIDKFLR